MLRVKQAFIVGMHGYAFDRPLGPVRTAWACARNACILANVSPLSLAIRLEWFNTENHEAAMLTPFSEVLFHMSIIVHGSSNETNGLLCDSR